ncbi:transmembrane protein, putative [Bodo saltans]|uniref:Transmembrane protein, putative n=1 Tax=Bodo saltans TaxID=75058 RepID=A0A0S4JIB3_BODSA|nr:transmembrane protein, putative [Bodo saltans]|eukprot:CUG89900.1 transmembrane protein, putative [Bodo saltans]
MVDGVVRFVGCVNLVAFFISDFYFAYVLHQLKQDHPSIDECSPGGNDDEEMDAMAVMSTLQKTVQDLAAGTSLGVAASIGRRMEEGDRSNYDSLSPAKERSKLIHKFVIIASFAAPIFGFLQIMAPIAMSWSMFEVPTWLGYLSVIPGLGVCMFYASRALRVANFEDVSKSQWLAMMWFRLDMMCVMGVVMLLGWGDWLLALCLFVVALYLAHRLLVTERRLSAELKNTQLIREEINLETLKPTASSLSGGVESANKGYDAIRR